MGKVRNKLRHIRTKARKFYSLKHKLGSKIARRRRR